MLSYVLFMLLNQGAFLYADNLINCMVIGLMFRYNERHFKSLCRPCIVLCFSCDKSSSELERKVKAYMEGGETVLSGSGSNNGDESGHGAGHTVMVPRVLSASSHLEAGVEMQSTHSFEEDKSQVSGFHSGLITPPLSPQNSAAPPEMDVEI